jgi:hypothetical protein
MLPMNQHHPDGCKRNVTSEKSSGCNQLIFWPPEEVPAHAAGGTRSISRNSSVPWAKLQWSLKQTPNAMNLWHLTPDHFQNVALNST